LSIQIYSFNISPAPGNNLVWISGRAQRSSATRLGLLRTHFTHQDYRSSKLESSCCQASERPSIIHYHRSSPNAVNAANTLSSSCNIGKLPTLMTIKTPNGSSQCLDEFLSIPIRIQSFIQPQILITIFLVELLELTVQLKMKFAIVFSFAALAIAVPVPQRFGRTCSKINVPKWLQRLTAD
jgi:hypothetical protein